MNKKVTVALILLLVGVLAGGAAYLVLTNSKGEPATSSSESASSSSSASSSASSSSSSSSSSEPVPSFTITFKNWDETPLSSVTVKQGENAVYEGAEPTRPADAQYTYAFSGWDLPLTNIQASGDRIAQYLNSTNQYTITFVNYDGSELDKSVWDYGSTPSYSGTPSHPADAQYSYVFSGWSPTIVAVTANATYTAQYSSSVNQYTITFVNYDGTELEKSLWDYGATPSYSGTPGLALRRQSDEYRDCHHAAQRRGARGRLRRKRGDRRREIPRLPHPLLRLGLDGHPDAGDGWLRSDESHPLVRAR